VNHKFHPIALAAALITGFAGLPKAYAQLPMLDKQPWLGNFAVFANKRFNITISPQGNIELIPLNEKDEPVGKQLAITIDAGIEEIRPEGKVIMKEVKVDTLVSDDTPTEKLEKTTIRGNVTGGAEFELKLEQVRGIIFIGGRVLNAGTLTKNPVRFAVRVRIPNAYPYDDTQAASADKKAERAFIKKLKGDSLQVKWTDGKSVKQDFEKTVDVTSKELNGPGIASAEVDISSYTGKRIILTAAPNSSMTLRNQQPEPLHRGFTICWQADTAKDPESKARLAIEVR
jgi:hypothetical protein